MRNLTIGEKLLRIRNSRETAIEEIEFLANHIRLEDMMRETTYENQSDYEDKIIEIAKKISQMVEVVKELDELKTALEDKK